MGKTILTLKDVAKKTGFSASTVSRVLSDKDCVKAETRAKVLSVVNKLKYTPNTLARGLKLGHSNMIALIIPNIHNLMFPALTRGVEDAARKQGYMVILCNTDENIDVEKTYIQKMHNQWVDGFLVATMMPCSDHIRKLHDEGFPVVLTSRSYDTSIDAVVIDNIAAAYNATCYLITKGHRRIAFAMGPELVLYQDRMEGYRRALEDNGIAFDKSLIMFETDGLDSFYFLTIQIIKSQNPPDAIFASSDARAVIIMRALHDLKIKIPDDVAVVGFDNVDISGMVEPPLTTVSQPLYEIGALAAKKLIRQIQSVRLKGMLDPPVVDVLDTNLLIRGSA